MSAAVKTRHTENNAESARAGVILRFRPKTPAKVIKKIEREYSDYLLDGDDELVVWEETELAREIQGGGGGQPFYATAGGKYPQGLGKALQMAAQLIEA